ncbi:MAG: 3-dehydroquinate synthase [Alphaproteobacteria bacterium]
MTQRPTMATAPEHQERTETIRIAVEVPGHDYDILIGPGLLGCAGKLLRASVGKAPLVIISDETVAEHYLDPLHQSLADVNLTARHIILPPGEATKSFDRLGSVLDSMLAMGIERQSTVIALGGGVVGDLAGLAAAIALRGIGYVQIPTTLLAQVDSSIGGKTAVDSPAGKNLIGAFHQPRAVLADTDTLSTLPLRDLKSGYGEVVKYGLLGDAAFFAWLERSGKAVLDRDPAALSRAIAESCRAKARIVAADEREVGARALLNLGHTFAHALEAEAGFDTTLLHGEAVTLGMLMAFDLSVRLGHCPPADRERVARHFSNLGLLHALPTLPDGRTWNADRLLDRMAADKKVVDGALTFILARGIGAAFVARGVARDDVRAVLSDHGA